MWSAVVPWTRTSGGPVAGREDARSACRRATRRRGPASVIRAAPSARAAPTAAASSRIQVAPGAPGELAGPAPRVALRAEDRREHRRPCRRRRPRPARPARPRRPPGCSVTRSTCGSMWVGAGMASASSVRVERRRAREDRQQVAVAARSRGTPGRTTGQPSPSREPGRAELVGELGGAPRGAARLGRSPRPSGTGGRGRPGAGRPAGAAGRALLGPCRCRAGCRRTALTFESGWSRGTNRSSPHQTWTSAHGTASPSGGALSRR